MILFHYSFPLSGTFSITVQKLNWKQIAGIYLILTFWLKWNRKHSTALPRRSADFRKYQKVGFYEHLHWRQRQRNYPTCKPHCSLQHTLVGSILEPFCSMFLDSLCQLNPTTCHYTHPFCITGCPASCKLIHRDIQKSLTCLIFKTYF